MGFLVFIFFLIVLVIMLTGSHIKKTIRRVREAAEKAAEAEEHQYREETGRQRQQYSQRAQPRQATQDKGSQAGDGTEQRAEAERYSRTTAQQTKTATGETIIDNHRQQRSDRKIFDDDDAEYVDFVEEQ